MSFMIIAKYRKLVTTGSKKTNYKNVIVLITHQTLIEFLRQSQYFIGNSIIISLTILWSIRPSEMFFTAENLMIS